MTRIEVIIISLYVEVLVSHLGFNLKYLARLLLTNFFGSRERIIGFRPKLSREGLSGTFLVMCRGTRRSVSLFQLQKVVAFRRKRDFSN